MKKNLPAPFMAERKTPQEMRELKIQLRKDYRIPLEHMGFSLCTSLAGFGICAHVGLLHSYEGSANQCSIERIARRVFPNEYEGVPVKIRYMPVVKYLVSSTRARVLREAGA